MATKNRSWKGLEPQATKPEVRAALLTLKINRGDNYRTLAALAAFNQITLEECAERILNADLKMHTEEMNFRGEMIV